MASPAFSMPSGSNNAPPPTFGSFTNPTGSQTQGFSAGGNFPNFPMFGAPSGGPVSPMANLPAFGMGGMSGMSSGFDLGSNWQNFDNSLGKAFGKGTGQALYNIFDKGLFNPQVANSFLNAMQPGINRGVASLQNSFGAEGARFGSAAALGTGDLLSQANLNEQQTLAGLYTTAQQEQLQLLEGILPTMHAEQANKGGWMDDLIGGLEMAGGVASMFVPGLQGIGGALIAGGAGTLAKGIGGGGGGSGTPMFGMSGMGGNTGTFGSNAPSYANWNGSTNGIPNSLLHDPYWQGGNQADIMQVGGGQALGGAGFDWADPNNPMFGMLQ